jgi:hypothetical protein
MKKGNPKTQNSPNALKFQEASLVKNKIKESQNNL